MNEDDEKTDDKTPEKANHSARFTGVSRLGDKNSTTTTHNRNR